MKRTCLQKNTTCPDLSRNTHVQTTCELHPDVNILKDRPFDPKGIQYVKSFVRMKNSQFSLLHFFLFIIFLLPLASLGDVVENFDAWSDGTYGSTSTYTDASGGQWESYNAMSHASNARSGNAIRFNDDSGANEYLLYKGTDGNGKDNGLASVSFWYRHWNGDASSVRFLAQYNRNGEGWMNIGDTTEVTSADYMFFSENLNLSGNNILFRILSVNDEERLLIDDLVLENYTAGPQINVSTNTLDAFFYIEGTGPSDADSFRVSAVHLTQDLRLSCPPGFCLSTDGLSFFESDLVLEETEGSVDTLNIFTRMVSDLSEGTYVQNIVCSSEGATNETIQCNGTVYPAAFSSMVINEVDADTRGTDREEFVELFDGGTGNTSLNGLVLVLFNGDGDVSYTAFDLDTYTTGADGYFVLGSNRLMEVDVAAWESNGLQNGPDAIAVYLGDADDFPTGTPCTLVQLLDAVVYDTDDPDDEGLLQLLHAGSPQVNENHSANSSNYSLQRMGDGSGGQQNSVTFSTAFPTPGQANFDACWTGESSNNWTDLGNWFPGEVMPDLESRVFIPGSCPFFPEILAPDTLEQLTLDHNGQINGQENLVVTEMQTIHPIGYSTSETLIDRWQLVSSPFSDLTVAGFISPNNRTDVWCAGYNPSLSSNIHRSWEYINDPEIPMPPGTGFALATTNDETEEGNTVYDSEYVVLLQGAPADLSAGLNLPLRVDSSGWNLLGNSFLAPINWFDHESIQYGTCQGNAAYLFDPESGSYITLSSDGSGGGVVVPSSFDPLIPPLQGFFVEASAEGNLFIGASARVNDPAPFLKSAQTDWNIHIIVSSDTLSDETVLCWHPGAENGFDRFDAHKLFPNNAHAPLIYSLAGDQHPVSVNRISSLPVSIPLMIKTGNDAIHRVSFQYDASFPLPVRCIFETEKTTKNTLLSPGSILSFPGVEAGHIIEMLIQIEESTTNERDTPSPGLFVSLKNNILSYRNFPSGESVMQIWNIRGEKAGRYRTCQSAGTVQLNLSDGFYVVLVEHKQKRVIQKFFITR